AAPARPGRAARPPHTAAPSSPTRPTPSAAPAHPAPPAFAPRSSRAQTQLRRARSSRALPLCAPICRRCGIAVAGRSFAAFPALGKEPPLELVGRMGTPEQEALDEVEAHAAHRRILLARLDALKAHADAHRMAELHDEPDERRIERAVKD